MTPAPARDGWPRLMRAETAAAYTDEVSADAFRRKVGTDYPPPCTKGRPAKWLRDDLDAAIGRLRPRQEGQTTPATMPALPPGFDAKHVL